MPSSRVSAIPETDIEHGPSLWADARTRFLGNKAAVAGLIVLASMGTLVLLGPLLTPHASEALDFDRLWLPPGIADQHWFGTDSLGRDLFARCLQGGRISLLVGLVATLVSVLIGVSYGAAAGYAGGRIDAVMMRAVDILYALPFLFFVILLMVAFGRHLVLIFVAIGAVNWLDMARIVRGQTLSLKRKEFVEAAVISGAGTGRILSAYILPNLLGIVAIYATLTVPQVILIESLLSFLGLGVQPPDTSWGALVQEGAQEMERAPWLLVFPATMLALTLLSFNFVGDGLRDALDPKDR
jgi:oligopeptide transport system permease protein